MNIAPVSFGSAPMEFSERIKVPQKYAQAETPAAATSLSSVNKKESSFGQKLFKFVLVAGAVATGLALAAKHGIFKSEKITNETAKKALGHLQTAGEKIGEKASKYYGMAKEKLSALTKKGVETATEVAGEVAEKAPEVAEEVKSAIV